ncbi:MAG: ATP-binding protein [Rikenellaceae bacterium]|nr:ATP-binding protein [Rikenellaceae bacterium]
MDFSIILGLVQNIAILISFTLIYDLLWEKSGYFSMILYKIFIGVVIGIIGIVLMLSPWVMIPGLVFDTRSVLFVNAGLFFGPIATIVAITIDVAFRSFQGGPGIWMGALTIVSSGLTGLIWKKMFPEWRKGRYIYHLFIVSIIAHIFMLLSTLALPSALIIPTLRNITLPVLILYPLATVLLGIILVKRMRYWKTSNELSFSEERNRMFMDANKDCMFVKDENLRYIFFNAAMQKFLGKKPERIMNNTDSDLIEPGHASLCSSTDLRAREEKRMIIEEEHVGKKIYKVIKFPLNFGNERIGVGGIIRDVTENRRKGKLQQALLNISRIFLENITMKEFLKRSHDELRKVVVADNIFIAIYHEKEDKYSFPYYVDEYDKFDEDNLVSLDHTLTDYIRRSAKGRLVTMDVEKEIDKEFGLSTWGTESPIWMAAPLFDITHKKVLGVVVLQDYHDKEAYKEDDLVTLEIFAAYIGLYYDKLMKIEDLKLAKERAEVSDKLKTAFLANVSHEIRAPMNGIIGFSDLLMNEVKEEHLKNYISIISKSAYRLLDTVNDVVDMAKLEAGQVVTQCEKFNLGDVIKYIYVFFSHKNYPVELKVFPSEDVDLIVYSDKAKLTQIFVNLVSNALKFTMSGSVEFGFYYDKDHEGDPDHITFFVKDTGCGIAESEQGKIFERFYQVESSLTRVSEGTGLGLAIVKEYVSILGGEIWVESEIEKGATFFFNVKLTDN